MYEKIFSNAKAMSLDDLVKHAESIGLSSEKFRECLDSGKHAAEIRKDIAEGRKASVRGTPSFLLGLTNPDDSKLKATKLLRGAVPYARFKDAIDSLLALE